MSDGFRQRRLSDAGEWISAAEQDYRAAGLLLAAAPPLLEASAFHCRQSAEKPLKALLVLESKPPPKTHDLGRLHARLDLHAPLLSDILEALEGLTPWAVTGRYPDLGEPAPTEAEIRQAIGLLVTVP